MIALLASTWMAAAGAQEPGAQESGAGDARLTLWQAVERALDSHPSVGAARSRYEAANAAAREAEAVPGPKVSLTASATRFEEPMVVSPIHAFEPGQTPQFDESLLQAALQVDYKLFDGGRRGAGIDLARARADAAEAGTRNHEGALVAGTVSTYLGILNAGEILAAHEERLAALEAERDRVEKRLDVGRAPAVELRRIEAVVAAAGAERVSMAATLETAERQLARWIGGAPDETRLDRLAPVRLADEEAAERRRRAEEAIGSSPAVEGARRSLLAAEAAVALARAGKSPELAAVGRFVDFASGRGNASAEWSAGVLLAVPLYDGGVTRERIARAEADRAAAAEELRLALLEAEGGLDLALAAIEESAARRESLELAVASFAEVARTEKLRLDVGTGTQTDYLDAEADLLAARANLARARHSEIAARAELARVTGELSPAWLRTALEEEP